MIRAKARKTATRSRSESRDATTTDAIIYLRVSDKGQVENGNGLESQRTTCCEYADRKGYSVIATFSDDLSGKTANRVLTNPLYAGYVHVPRWDVSLRPGHHPALISFETFQRIQRRLEGNSKHIVFKDNSRDFPLRGFVVCGTCGTKLTAYWAKGGKYPYYHCRKPDCEAYSRSITRAKIEGDFSDLLRSMQPTRERIEMVRQGLGELWRGQDDATALRKKALTDEIREIDQEIKKLVNRVIETESLTLIAAYETRINEAEARKVLLIEKRGNLGKPRGSFDDLFRTAIAFLSSPWKLWDSGEFSHKRMVIQLDFRGNLEYVRDSGFRTPLTSSPFRLFRVSDGEMKTLARPA